mgnify:FL=1
MTLRLRALYRKFDTTFVRHFSGADAVNDLPIVELAADEVSLPVTGGGELAAPNPDSAIPLWQRWNDYGIGLLRQSGPMARGSLAAAARAFAEVEKLGKPDGALNQARVFLAEGQNVELARRALDRAATFSPPSPPWLLAWFEAQVARREGRLDVAIAALGKLLETPWPQARERGFDFSGDDRVWSLLGQLELERVQELAEDDPEVRAGFERARHAFASVLERDPENAMAHYSLARIARAGGDEIEAARLIASFERYRGDDPDRDRARDAARRADPVADFQAEPLVVFELQPPGAALEPSP